MPADIEAIKEVSKIDVDFLIEYLRIDDASDTQKREINTMLVAAKSFIAGFTGLPEATEGEPEGETRETLDSYPEFVMAVCVLVQNHYDNRTFYVDKNNVEKVVDSIIGMHRVNFL